MTEDQRHKLQSALWGVANILRRRMTAYEYRDYILGFIFYKYLSEKLVLFANKTLKSDQLIFNDIDEHTPVDLKAVTT